MKKTVCLISALLIIAFSALPVYAAKERVIDTADLLTSEEEQKLSALAGEVYEKYGVDIVILLEDTYVSSPQRHAEDYYDNGGYADDGIIFYLSVYDRDWYMATSGSCMDTLSDSRLDDIFEEIKSDLAKNEFYDALSSFIPLCEGYIEAGPSFSATPVGGYILNMCILLPVAFVVALVVVSLEKKKMNTAVLQKNANDYIINGSVDIKEQKDVFVTSTVTRVPISQGSGSGGGGRSHGGRGGKF